MSVMHQVVVRLKGRNIDHVLEGGMQIAERVYPGREVVLDETSATHVAGTSNWQFVLRYLAVDRSDVNTNPDQESTP